MTLKFYLWHDVNGTQPGSNGERTEALRGASDHPRSRSVGWRAAFVYFLVEVQQSIEEKRQRMQQGKIKRAAEHHPNLSFIHTLRLFCQITMVQPIRAIVEL